MLCFSLSTCHLDSFSLHFFGRSVVSKRPVKLGNPFWTLDVIEGRQGLCQHNRKTTWPFVCIFVCAVCLCECICVVSCWCVNAWVYEVAHKYTVQYSFRYSPPWRINAWTELWQGANISETTTLYSVDNCLTFFFLLNPKKMNFGRIYINICIIQKLNANHDRHLNFHLLLPGFRNNQKFLF